MDDPRPDYSPAPSLLDPRLMLLVPTDCRPAMAALWRLEARLFDVVVQRREDMLAQLKLAWWRDRLVQLANDPVALPKGEPLLAELAPAWAGCDTLATMADGYEAAMLAGGTVEAKEAARLLAQAMQRALVAIGIRHEPPIWSLVRAAQMSANRDVARSLWAEAGAIVPSKNAPRAVRALERWAQLIAKHDGAAPARAEAWLLLRAGLGF
jgi:15-cis-phytoene synthase